MKLFVAFLWMVLLLAASSFLAVPVHARGVYCVGPSATGDGSGSDWNNLKAWSGTPARGDTWYLVDGSYASKTFSTAVSGSTLIKIKKATVADHGGISTGWSDTVGDGQAFFTAPINFGSSYWVFDGANGSLTTNTAAYGFAFTQSSGAVVIGTTDGQNITDITLSHIYAKALTGDMAKRCFQTWSQIGSTARLTFRYNLCDGWQGQILVASPNNNAHANYLIEYNLFINGFSSPTYHGEMINADYGGLQNPIIRYNIFRGWSADSTSCETGCICANNSDITGAEIYGNVFDGTRNCNGIVVGTGPGFLINCSVYNNTFLNLYPNSPPAWVEGSWSGAAGASGNVAYNNLIYNMVANVGHAVTDDYNAYFSTTSTPTETHEQKGSGNPFKNSAAYDYTLKVNTTPGIVLGAPYDVDPLGNARTTWTRGAYEFAAPTPPPTLAIAPTGTNAVMVCWAASATGFRLQQKASLGGTNWLDVVNAPTIVNTQNQVVAPQLSGSWVFRLVSP